MASSRTIRTVAWLALIVGYGGLNVPTLTAQTTSADTTVFPVPPVMESGRTLSTEEAITWLEAKAKQDTTFLDAPRGAGRQRTNGPTFRTLLNQLRAFRDGKPSAAPAAKDGNVVNGNDGQTFHSPIHNPYTLITDATTGNEVLIAASMTVVPQEDAVADTVMQDMTIAGVSAPVVFTHTKPLPANLAWPVVYLARFSNPGILDVTTRHHAHGKKDGDAWSVTMAREIVK